MTENSRKGFEPEIDDGLLGGYTDSQFKGPHFNFEPSVGSEEYPAWEEVGAGRYMPRRVRGSCAGRALG